MKKKILFVYYTMMLGGSTTSLLSLLDNINYDEYEVDLLLYKNEGPFLDYIPKEVNLLPQAFRQQSCFSKVLKGVLSGRLIRSYLHGIRHYKKCKPTLQSMAYTQLLYSRKLQKEYDIAIGFMELWSDVYLNLRVQAKRKISWVHVDYEKAHFIPKTDLKMFSHSDHIVHVSEKCLDNFATALPSLAPKCVFIPNILTKSFLEKRATRKSVTIPPLPSDALKLLSVCRIAIDHKGLDRGLTVLQKLKEEGKRVVWVIIGDGPDRQKFESMVKAAHMENEILLLGRSENPYGCYHLFDAFFAPSRFEGKPMAVTEAQMLSLPPVVTEYASAKEQIEHEVDGLITDNDEDGIYRILSRVYDDRSLLEQCRKNSAQKNYDNTEEIEKIYSLFLA